MSRNSPETGVRVLNTIRQLNLGISRSVFTGGESVVDYLQAFDSDKRHQDRRNQISYIARTLTDVPKLADISGIIFSQITVVEGKPYPAEKVQRKFSFKDVPGQNEK